jgi:hypothetical protein
MEIHERDVLSVILIRVNLDFDAVAAAMVGTGNKARLKQKTSVRSPQG